MTDPITPGDGVRADEQIRTADPFIMRMPRRLSLVVVLGAGGLGQASFGRFAPTRLAIDAGSCVASTLPFRTGASGVAVGLRFRVWPRRRMTHDSHCIAARRTRARIIASVGTGPPRGANVPLGTRSFAPGLVGLSRGDRARGGAVLPSPGTRSGQVTVDPRPPAPL